MITLCRKNYFSPPWWSRLGKIEKWIRVGLSRARAGVISVFLCNIFHVTCGVFSKNTERPSVKVNTMLFVSYYLRTCVGICGLFHYTNDCIIMGPCRNQLGVQHELVIFAHRRLCRSFAFYNVTVKKIHKTVDYVFLEKRHTPLKTFAACSVAMTLYTISFFLFIRGMRDEFKSYASCPKPSKISFLRATFTANVKLLSFEAVLGIVHEILMHNVTRPEIKVMPRFRST
jgi:hypothetical protein